MSISYAEWRKEFMAIITISEWFIYERVLIRCFPEKNECKISVFSFGHSDSVCVDAEK